MRRPAVIAAFLLARLLGAAGVVARFDPATPGIGPFPTDFLTVTDAAQATGLRVNLPGSDRETALVNQLDGFNIQPRVRVRFSGPVNPETLRRGIFLLRADGQTVRVNQVVWEPTTNTAYAEVDQTLAPHTRYTLVVTTAVRDPAGDPVQPDPAFQRCLAFADGYCGRLSLALEPLMIRVLPARARAAPGEVVAASTFTTLTTTTWLEKARVAIQNSPIGFTRQAPRAVFDINDILSLTLRLQERDNPVQLTDFTVPLPPQVLLAGVDRIAFGSFRSPNFLNADGTIPATSTGAPVTLPAASTEVLFHVLLPNSSRPATGYPVILFGHGLDDSRFGAPSLVASTFARSGFATVAMNAVGHGSGPHGVLHLTLLNGSSYDIPAGGRSVDRNGDGLIESKEGCLIVEPIPVGLRDCVRQTALDLMQLIRAVRSGLDVDGDGVVDLDPNRIYYAGQSLGAIYGTVLLGVEPDIRAAVFNAGGGSVMDIARWSPSFHGFPREFLEKRVPPLLNRPPDYNENYVLRNRPAKVNDVAGAIDIQNVFENVEWLQIAGDPLAYGGQLKAPVLWQFARGDRTVPNPQTTALLRAAGATQNVQLYRHDLARAVSQDLVENPHGYLVDIRSAGGISIALAVQSQIAGFFAANGTTIPGANSLQVRILFGRNLFEVPEALPEDLGW